MALIQSTSIKHPLCARSFAFVITLGSPNNPAQASQVALLVKNPPASAGDARDMDSTLDEEDPLEEEMITHSHILAWKIPRTEEPGRHDWVTEYRSNQSIILLGRCEVQDQTRRWCPRRQLVKLVLEAQTPLALRRYPWARVTPGFLVNTQWFNQWMSEWWESPVRLAGKSGNCLWRGVSWTQIEMGLESSTWGYGYDVVAAGRHQGF